MQADVEWIFPILLNWNSYCSSFLQCPVTFKMFILFRDVFFDMPDRQSKGQKKTWFGFGMITLDLDDPPSKEDSALKIIISQM